MSAIDELAALNPIELHPDELSDLLVETSQALNRLAALRIRVTQTFHEHGYADRDGHLSTTAWLVDRCRLSGGEAAETVRLAKALRSMPHTALAFSEGSIGLAAVRPLAKAATAHPDEFSQHEETLLEAVRDLPVRSVGKAVAYWCQAVDWEHVAADNDALYERRRVHVSPTWGGMVRIDGDLDPESGDIVMTALAAATPTPVNGEPLTATQRRADTLVQVCRSYLDRGDAATTGGVKPHLSVIVDLQVLQDNSPGTSETTRGTVLDPETARRLACDAAVSRVVVAGDSAPLEVGRTTRVIPPAIRRALIVRDGGCSHPGCDRPPEWTDAHHITHWAAGGQTNLGNLRLLCRRHHRIAHRSEWEP